jgi:hypothetical protein
MAIMNVETANAPTPPVGVIESLTAGFETVAGHLVLLILPLLLDLLLWVGPRLSMRPALMEYYQDVWLPALTSFDGEVQEAFEGMSQTILTTAQELPDTYLPQFGIPTLMAGREAMPLPFDFQPPLWEVQHPAGLVGINCGALAVSLALGSVYVALIASRIRTGRIALKSMLSHLPAQLMWIGVLAVCIPIVLLIIYLPFAMLAMGLSLLSGVVGMLFDWIGRLLVLWIGLFLIFTIHGILLNDRNAFGALWDSIRVVQWNMSATLLLIMLIVLLNMALSYVWSMAPAGSWLAPVAIVGNAFISTGLITATFVFFKDRYRYWREMRAVLLAELERRRAEQGKSPTNWRS